MIPPSERDQAFADYLRTLAQSGGARVLATLARARPDGGGLRSWQWLGPWTLNVDCAEAQRLLLVAGLFALHPGLGRRGNMGTVFTRLRRLKGSSGSLDQRFMALLQAHRDDLPGHLRRAVGLARSAQVEVDWAQLLVDLRLWNHPRQLVQRAWAREYWGRAGGRCEGEP